jgi:ADP-heptose:LPS heptosyltransferase
MPRKPIKSHDPSGGPMLRVDTRLPPAMVKKIDALLRYPGQKRADVIRDLLWTRLSQLEDEQVRLPDQSPEKPQIVLNPARCAHADSKRDEQMGKG